MYLTVLGEPGCKRQVLYAKWLVILKHGSAVCAALPYVSAAGVGFRVSMLTGRKLVYPMQMTKTIGKS